MGTKTFAAESNAAPTTSVNGWPVAKRVAAAADQTPRQLFWTKGYANTGIATDSARKSRATSIAKWLAKPCRHLFAANPMPELKVPNSGNPVASELRVSA